MSKSGREPAPPRPPALWCAVWLHPTLGIYAGATEWLGDLERPIARAWIEGDHRD